MKRRRMLQSLGAALLGWPLAARCGWAKQQSPRKILFFSRSALFEHPVIRREDGQLSFAEKALVEMARQIDCTVECTKDGRVFERDLDAYAAVVSYTCGRPEHLLKPIKADGQDGNQPLSEAGWNNLEAAVREGKPFVAIVKTCGRARFSSSSCWAGCRGPWAGWRPTSRPTSTRLHRRPTSS